jgi:hypothetical protein
LKLEDGCLRQCGKVIDVARFLTYARGTWGLLVLSQTRQQLAETLLAGARSTALCALPADIHDLGNALPAGAPRGRVLAGGQELLGILAGRGDLLLLLVVVVLVEVIDVALCLRDGLFALSRKLLCPLGVASVALLSPLLDHLWLLLLLGVGREARVVADRRAGRSDVAARGYCLRDRKEWSGPRSWGCGECGKGQTNLVRASKIGELLLKLGRLGAAAAATKQIVVANVESVTVLYGRKLVCIVTKDCLLSGKEVIGGWVNGRVLNIRLCCMQFSVSEVSETEV